MKNDKNNKDNTAKYYNALNKNIQSNNNTEEYKFLEDHIEDLRKRIIYILYAFLSLTIVCFIDQRFYMKIVLLPHKWVMKNLKYNIPLQVIRYEESFLVYLKVSLISSAILTMPFALYQLWLFVKTALYPEEIEKIKFYAPFIFIFFIGGVVFGYFILIPFGLTFLAKYGGEDIQIGFTLSSYISIFFNLTFICGIIFELPFIMIILDKLGIFTKEIYIKYWKYFIFAIFVIAAVLTPPDVFTQLFLAFPLICLYLLGILGCYFL